MSCMKLSAYLSFTYVYKKMKEEKKMSIPFVFDDDGVDSLSISSTPTK